MTDDEIPAGFLVDEYSQNKGGQILKSGDNIYHCTLNQTSINENRMFFKGYIKIGEMAAPIRN